MVRFAFMYPVFRNAGFSLQLNEWVFAVFAFAFVFMAAGGYIINDYYDVEMDKINKPEKVIMGKQIPSSKAYIGYWIFSILGLVMGCWACYKAGLFSLSVVFIVYMSGLWYYSNTLKYQLIIGNILVAFFLALVPFTAGIIELYCDIKNPAFSGDGLQLNLLFYWIAGISVFAFISSLSREIVKDMQDMEGDVAAGGRTLPVVAGKKTARRVVQFLLLLMFFLLAYIQHYQWEINDMKSFIYFSCFIQLPVLFIIMKLNKADAPRDFHKISNWLKILMVSGISYLFVFAYICLHSI